MKKTELIDSHNRHIKKLRLSILEMCNLRCKYCMPANPDFMKRSQHLTSLEIHKICSNLVKHGIEEIRVTGGEPTLHPEFQQIMSDLASLPLKKLALTTNGFFLDQHLDFLKSKSIEHLNISLDSLNPKTFEEITGKSEIPLKAILKANDMGFKLKLNMVLLRGINDNEVLDFVKFSAEHQIEVRFLELMQIGQGRYLFSDHFISADKIIDCLKKEGELQVVPKEKDSTSFNFVNAQGAQIGFIASESKPFCGNCSRLRLSADGLLRSCLMKPEGLSLRGLPEASYSGVLAKVMSWKPTERIAEIDQDMYQIGG